VAVVVDSNGQLGTVSSSQRFKEDIEDMGDTSDGLMDLRPVTFRYKQPYQDGSKPIDYGLIAEEVAKIYPNLAVKGADGKIETVQYQKLTPMLLNELQKQNKKIEEQEDMIELQKEQIAKQEARLAAIESQLSAKGNQQ
jgi:predicted ribosome quality control (RQC) complex YloA/Tae2 family protein